MLPGNGDRAAATPFEVTGPIRWANIAKAEEKQDARERIDAGVATHSNKLCSCQFQCMCSHDWWRALPIEFSGGHRVQ